VAEKVRAGGIALVSGSTLMSTTKGGLKELAGIIGQERLGAPLAVGGSAVSRAYVDTFDHAVYGKSPIDAVRIADKVREGKDWQSIRKDAP